MYCKEDKCIYQRTKTKVTTSRYNIIKFIKIYDNEKILKVVWEEKGNKTLFNIISHHGRVNLNRNEVHLLESVNKTKETNHPKYW